MTHLRARLAMGYASRDEFSLRLSWNISFVRLPPREGLGLRSQRAHSDHCMSVKAHPILRKLDHRAAIRFETWCRARGNHHRVFRGCAGPSLFSQTMGE